jgi:hypothetical protein
MKNLYKFTILIITIITLITIFLWLKEQFNIDFCLDSGGKWVYEKKTCEGNIL